MRGEIRRNLEPSYSIEEEHLGEGTAGYRNVLAKLGWVPEGSTVVLQQVGGFNIQSGSGPLGTLGVGQHPFFEPPELFDELNRIVEERHLRLEYVPPELDPDWVEVSDSRPQFASPYRLR